MSRHFKLDFFFYFFIDFHSLYFNITKSVKILFFKYNFLQSSKIEALALLL